MTLTKMQALNQDDDNELNMPPAPTLAPGQRRRSSSRVGQPDIVPPPEYPARERQEFDFGKTFGIDLGFEVDQNKRPITDAKGKKVKKTRMILGYKDRTPWVPEIDPTYVFPEDDLKIFLMGLESGDNVLAHGHTGVGKTSFFTQVAARLNYQVVRINLDDGISRPELIGEWVARQGEMIFMWGILPLAARMPGTIIILDEWDAMSRGASFALQRPLEKDDRRILVLETGGTLIPIHEENRFVATANTRGLGDDTGLYSGTSQQNFAQLNRFGLTIHMTWMDKEKEKEILRNKFSSPEKSLEPEEIDSLVNATELIRKAFSNQEVSVPLSPRDLWNWADKYAQLGSAIKAARYCFLNRMPPEDSDTVEQLIRRSFK